MRDGRMIGTHKVADVDSQTISNEMVGREVILTVQKGKASPGDKVLTARDLSTSTISASRPSITFPSLSERERFSASSAWMETDSRNWCASSPDRKGRFRAPWKWGGRDVTNARPGEMRRAGLAHIAEDRMTVGTALPASIEDNLMADRYYKPSFTGRGGFLRRDAMASSAAEIVATFDIRCNSPKQPVGSLSGGICRRLSLAANLPPTRTFS